MTLFNLLGSLLMHAPLTKLTMPSSDLSRHDHGAFPHAMSTFSPPVFDEMSELVIVENLFHIEEVFDTVSLELFLDC